MRDKRKPIAFGKAFNIVPVNVDGVFHTNDGRVDDVTFYAGGEKLSNEIADYPTVEELMAATVPSDAYATCRAYGAIKFGSDPDKQITADVTNTNAGYFLPPDEEPKP